MARFSQIVKGTHARQPIPFPTGDGPLPLPTVVEGKAVYPDTPETVLVDVRVIRSDEEADAHAFARAFAKKRHVDDATPGDEIYDLGLMGYVASIACLDHDSPADDPAPFFDNVEQALTLDADHLAYLHSAQRTWQDACAPRTRNMTPTELVGHFMALAVAEDDTPFLQLSPGVLRTAVRSLARLWWNSLESNLPSSSPTDSPRSDASPTPADASPTPAGPT